MQPSRLKEHFEPDLKRALPRDSLQEHPNPTQDLFIITLLCFTVGFHLSALGNETGTAFPLPPSDRQCRQTQIVCGVLERQGQFRKGRRGLCWGYCEWTKSGSHQLGWMQPMSTRLTLFPPGAKRTFAHPKHHLGICGFCFESTLFGHGLRGKPTRGKPVAPLGVPQFGDTPTSSSSPTTSFLAFNPGRQVILRDLDTLCTAYLGDGFFPSS